MDLFLQVARLRVLGELDDPNGRGHELALERERRAEHFSLRALAQKDCGICEGDVLLGKSPAVVPQDGVLDVLKRFLLRLNLIPEGDQTSCG